METVFICLVFGAGMLTSFVVGAKVGQKVVKGEAVEIPIPNPAKALREREERREAKAEADRFATIIENVDNYDGTPAGQKDVPR